MSRLADILRDHQTEFISAYAQRMQTVHHRAIEHILMCHTPACGEISSQCEDCLHNTVQHPSCGYLTNSDWLARQQQKLLPVDYYMVTFTVPRQLRPFVWHHQTWAYTMLFDCAVATLQSFFKRDKKRLGRAGLTAVLHTHARNLDFHPHVHLIVPAGSFNKRSKLWRQKKGLYLFKADNMVRVFRGKCIEAITQAGYRLPPNTPKKWNANCERVGKGGKALTYLARYLYRGVISEDNILSCHNGMVTFKYKNSTTKQYQTLTEPVTDFLWRVIQHVLPKGFRRARDYGFLHGNAKRTLQRIQLMLKVRLAPPPVPKLTQKCCPQCQGKLRIIWLKRARSTTQIRPSSLSLKRTNTAMECN